MELGGFVYLDLFGIKASFLGADLGHSYARGKKDLRLGICFLCFSGKTFIPLGQRS